MLRRMYAYDQQNNSGTGLCKKRPEKGWAELGCIRYVFQLYIAEKDTNNIAETLYCVKIVYDIDSRCQIKEKKSVFELYTG